MGICGKCSVLLSLLVLAVLQQPTSIDVGDSLVDYLKKQNRPSDRESRSELYARAFPQEKVKYVGSSSQNTRLLEMLVGEDLDAVASAKSAGERAALTEVPISTRQPSRLVDQIDRFPGWVPAEDFGFHGSYAVRTIARISGNYITAEDFMVIVNTAATKNGNLTIGGTVEICEGEHGKRTQIIRFQDAWFQTIKAADDGSASVYAMKGSRIDLPTGTRVVAKVSVSPVVVTSQGSVALWTRSYEVVLQDAKQK